jgi:hypothetical protein
MNILRFDSNIPCVVDPEMVNEFTEQAWLALHLAKLLKLLQQKYPDHEIGFFHHVLNPPITDPFSISVSPIEDSDPVASFSIDAATWTIIAYGADYEVDAENEFHGMHLRQVVNLMA